MVGLEGLEPSTPGLWVRRSNQLSYKPTLFISYLYPIGILFLIFVVIGSAASLGSVIGFSDAMIFAMMVPNMVGLVILAPKVKEELNKYLSAIKSKLS